MKKTFVSLLLFIIVFSISASAQIGSPYEVGTWQGFRSGAVSYTFDDNCPNQFSIAIPMFNEFGFKLTLFSVTATSNWGWLANWSNIQNAATQGHEVASHTVTHADFRDIADSLEEIEMKNSKATIESQVTGQKCVTFAYPYCATGNISLVEKYYIAARGCSGQIVGKTPSNFMNISSYVIGSAGSNTVASITGLANNAATAKGWVVYLLHGINGTESGAYSPIHQDTLRKSLEYLAASPDKFWVESFGTVAKYIRERNAASVSEISIKADTITVSITDTMDNEIYDTPITVRRPLPEGWASAKVFLNGEELISEIVEVSTVKYVMFDIVPDIGDIVLVKNGATSVNLQGMLSPTPAFELYENYPNPFNPTTTIQFSLAVNSNVRLFLVNALGQVIQEIVNGIYTAGTHRTSFNGAGLTSGVYFYRLETNTGFVKTKKLVLLK